jgi:hypothetical protein
MGATGGISKASWIAHIFPGGFKKAIFSSHAALGSCYSLQEEGLGKSENSKALCKMVYKTC